MQIQIRNMIPQDAETVNELSVQLGYPITVDETRDHIAAMQSLEEHCIQVALIEDRIVGWIHAFKTLRIETRPFIEIAGLVVDQEFRGRGIGKKLIEAMEQWCVQQKIKSLRVRCNTKRKEAHQFYQATGFRETKEQKIFEKMLAARN